MQFDPKIFNFCGHINLESLKKLKVGIVNGVDYVSEENRKYIVYFKRQAKMCFKKLDNVHQENQHEKGDQVIEINFNYSFIRSDHTKMTTKVKNIQVENVQHSPTRKMLNWKIHSINLDDGDLFYTDVNDVNYPIYTPSDLEEL